MKRFWMMLAVVLLAAALAGAASADDLADVRQLAQAVENDQYFSVPGDPLIYGSMLVYVDDGKGGAELSSERMTAEGYHGIPAACLARSLAEAASVVLVEPRSMGNQYLTHMLQTRVRVFDRLSGTVSGDVIVATGSALKGTDIDAACGWIVETLAGQAGNGDEASYMQAVNALAHGQYFTAWTGFRKSLWNDWGSLASRCVQPWPATGEIWHQGGLSQRMSLTISVNQEQQKAMHVRIFLNGQAVSELFIRGSGSAATRLPGGQYMIKVGTGRLWFGAEESFGRYGHYETMTFDENSSETVYLRDNGIYTLSINVEQSTGAGVGSEEESWEGFSR